jgi:hypothetical protein
MEKRMDELKGFIEKYFKQSHREALESATLLKQRVASHSPISVRAFPANILAATPLPSFLSGIDIVITDLPYGTLTSWSGVANETDAAGKLLEKLHDRFRKPAAMAISSHKKQKGEYRLDEYNAVATFTLERRRITLLEPILR